jgi:hypothetical protein
MKKVLLALFLTAAALFLSASPSRAAIVCTSYSIPWQCDRFGCCKGTCTSCEDTRTGEIIADYCIFSCFEWGL